MQLEVPLRLHRTANQRRRKQTIGAAIFLMSLLCKLIAYSNRLFACSAFVLQSIDLKLCTGQSFVTGNIHLSFVKS